MKPSDITHSTGTPIRLWRKPTAAILLILPVMLVGTAYAQLIVPKEVSPDKSPPATSKSIAAAESTWVAGRWTMGNETPWASLEITNVRPESFDYAISSSWHTHVGNIEGTAVIKANKAVGSFKDTGCILNFEMKDGLIRVDTNEACSWYGGANVTFSGVYNPEVPVPAAPDHAEARAFVQEFLDRANRANIEACAALYADTIEYYDNGIISKDLLIADKVKYFERWPVVHNSLDGSVKVRDLANGGGVLVEFDTEYRVSSPERNASISGKARNILTLKMIDGELRIVSEKGSVLSRNKGSG